MPSAASLRRLLTLALACACTLAAGCSKAKRRADTDGGPADASRDHDTPDASDGPLTDDELARLSVLLLSCYSDDGYLRTTTYLRPPEASSYFVHDLAVLRCLANTHGGCDGARVCLGLSDLKPGDPCDSCVGDVAILCGDIDTRWDCAKVSGECVAGSCSFGGGEACDTLSYQPMCDADGRPTDCDDGRVVSEAACPDYGLMCESSTPTCRGTLGACPDNDSYFDVHYYDGTACTDGRLTTCVNGGLAELDCAEIAPGFGCREVGSVYFCGIADECDPTTYEATCTGDSVRFCSAGRVETVACGDLGFTACVEGNRYPGCTGGGAPIVL